MSSESDSETTSGSSSLIDEDTVLVAPPTKARRRCVTPLHRKCRNGGSFEYMENARRENLQNGPKNREELQQDSAKHNSRREVLWGVSHFPSAAASYLSTLNDHETSYHPVQEPHSTPELG